MVRPSENWERLVRATLRREKLWHDGCDGHERAPIGITDSGPPSLTRGPQYRPNPLKLLMASVGVAPASGLRESQMVGVDRLPEEMNDMKIRDDKEMEATMVDGNGTETGHIIVTTIGGWNGQPKQAKCLETGESVAIKKVLQDKRYKNRELQTMRLLDHPNVVSLKHCFFSTTEKDELYLNLVLEYVPETVHRVIKHYNKLTRRMPLIYVKLYTYQVWCQPSFCLMKWLCGVSLYLTFDLSVFSPNYVHSLGKLVHANIEEYTTLASVISHLFLSDHV
ncbi:hypothetical protein RHMOL_Rhmol03G0146800 [Rhododendron molle]|nr:hypothetical protein RHMOL_Rhmol03G0146800 [Rhododendron molle]KAI8563921.1 hypothetical protein RHMOL_Rhmol03G0146800 [Rhododendron molle]